MKTRTATDAPGFKTYAGIVAAVLTYLATQELLDWPQWADVALNGIGVALAVYLAAPQPTTVVPRRDREAGYGLVELVVAVLLVLILVVVLLRLL